MEINEHRETEESTIAFLRQGIKKLFPHDVDIIVRLCLLEDYSVLGFDHIDIWSETLDAHLSESVLEDLRVGYILLSAYYFLLDAVMDGHVAEVEDPLYLSHLFSGAYTLWHRACLEIAPDRKEAFYACFLSHVSANANAVKLEVSLCQHPLRVTPGLDRECIVGRSDSAFLLYHVLCILSGCTPQPIIENLLSSFVYFVQLGDDLNDWKKDYSLGIWTSLLRFCFSRHGRILSEREVEDEIYLRGVFEERLAFMINGYREMLQQLEQPGFPCTQFRRWVQNEHDRAMKVLTNAVTCKLSDEFECSNL